MTYTQISTVDYHTGGEPFRIVSDPPLPIVGTSVADRRVTAISDPAIERLRQLLCFEPRGHADMYGGLITPPDDAGAHFGVLFWHKDGFSTACGHGTIALGAWAIQSGLVARDATGTTDVVIDVPSGRVIARVHERDGVVASIDFVSVASFLVARDVTAQTSRGLVRVHIAFGGAMYAHLRASDVGLEVTPDNVQELTAIGRELKWILNDSEHAQHPADERLSGIYGTIIYDDLGSDPAGNPHHRNVTIFADGEVDRSPCGSGTASRVAALHALGELGAGRSLVHDSIVGSRFHGVVLENVVIHGLPAVIPQVTGMAYKTGEHTFEVDPRDPLVPGFVLR